MDPNSIQRKTQSSGRSGHGLAWRTINGVQEQATTRDDVQNFEGQRQDSRREINWWDGDSL